ncbi:MAG: hypothetical protein IIC60_03860 [Proteobacteria bacterium]|nr:hypothetical protein [Pseudomonadota bacterium]
MNNHHGTIDFTTADLAGGSSVGFYDATPSFESARFQDEYRSFEFEAMTEVPFALSAFISHQHSFDI